MAKEFPNKDQQFKPGESGNPEGRPPGTENSSTRLKKIFGVIQSKMNKVTQAQEELTVLEQMDIEQVIKALDGDTAAYEKLLDRYEGKPIQTNQLQGGDASKPISVSSIEVNGHLIPI